VNDVFVVYVHDSSLPIVARSQTLSPKLRRIAEEVSVYSHKHVTLDGITVLVSSVILTASLTGHVLN